MIFKKREEKEKAVLLTLYSSKNPEKDGSQFPQKNETVKLSSTLIILKMFLEQQIRTLE